ncbi:MAG: hypothetical protein V1662_04395 [Candidatus Omnitrophota bacterium]
MRKRNPVIKIVVSSLLAIFIGAGSRAEKTAAEENLSNKRINCKDGKHSYVVYLPLNYNESQKWPVLFCFDPLAQGEYAAQLFSSAAIDYGWIVAGSLDAKNGPWEPIREAQKAMLEDITQRYNVDKQCLYAAGFSGGARMSYTMAYEHPDMFRGVIACGAGFGEGEITRNIAVFHCVGSDDGNYREVRDAHGTLGAEGVKSRMRIFQGGHQWPPEKIIREALEWISKI